MVIRWLEVASPRRAAGQRFFEYSYWLTGRHSSSPFSVSVHGDLASPADLGLDE